MQKILDSAKRLRYITLGHKHANMIEAIGVSMHMLQIFRLCKTIYL